MNELKLFFLSKGMREKKVYRAVDGNNLSFVTHLDALMEEVEICLFH